MIIQPFIFGSVDDDLAKEFAEVQTWSSQKLGQSHSIEPSKDFAVLAFVVTASIHSDSRLFNEGYHLQTLLNQIDISFPYVFFCLGDSYGSIYSELANFQGEQNIKTSIGLGHSWLQDRKIRQSSLLNILIHYATIKANGRSGYSAVGKLGPFVYIRRPTFDRSISLMTENGRFAHQRAPHVLADAVRLDALKREILSNDLKMRFFNTSTQLIDHMTADIRKCAMTEDGALIGAGLIMTPAINTMADELQTKVEFDRELEAGKIVALVGNPASGKHQLLHYWLSEFSELNPGIPVSMFRGDPDAPSPDLNSAAYLMENAINVFRSFYREFDRILKDGRIIECLEARQLHQMEQEFEASLAFGPCLLVIKDLECVTCGRCFEQGSTTGSGVEVKIKQLQWLPEILPPKCRIVVTTVASDMTMAALQRRQDVEFLDASALTNDFAFKKAFFESECVAISKFSPHLLSSIFSSPVSNSPIHLSAIGRILASPDSLERLEYHAESLFELPRLRDLFARELRRWTTLPSMATLKVGSNPEESDRSTSWIPVFLRYMVLSRYGLPVRLIMPMLRLIMGIKKSSNQNNKVVERWYTFWQCSNYLFAAGSRNTIKLATEPIRRALGVILFDNANHSFSVWRKRYIRFLQGLPHFIKDPVVVDELIIQCDHGDDFPAVLQLLGNGNIFSRLVSNTGNSEVFTLSLLTRIEANWPGMFNYLVGRWLNGLGAFDENLVGDLTARSDEASEAAETTLKLPDGSVRQCNFAWLIADWLFLTTRLSPGDANYQVARNMFTNLIPMLAQFCENQLEKNGENAESMAALARFLMRCSARFAAPRFGNIKLAMETMKNAARLFKKTEDLLFQNENSIGEMLNQSYEVDSISQAVDRLQAKPISDFHKLIQYSYISAQLECCEMCFKLGDMSKAREAMQAAEPYLQATGQSTWPPNVCRHLFCLSLFSQSSTDAEQCENFLRSAAEISTAWYGSKHAAVADTLLALGCILTSRATMPKFDRFDSSRPPSRQTLSVDSLQQIIDALFTSKEVEDCFRKAIAILDERRQNAGGDTERLSFACASLGRFLSHLPTSSAKREAAELLQKAADLALLENGKEDYTVKWLRNLAKNTLLAMPPLWFLHLKRQQQAEDATIATTRPYSSRLRSYVHNRQISAASLRTRPATTQTFDTSNKKRIQPSFYRQQSNTLNKNKFIRPKTSLGVPNEFRH